MNKSPSSQPASTAELFASAKWTKDALSGFMVFLIALPLCLAISKASGCPAIAGVLTAIAGGVLATAISNSQLTIKGPAAGMIVIVLGCVTDFRAYLTDLPGQSLSSEQIAFEAYRLMLAVGVAAGVLQVLFGLFRAGILGDFFPSSAVHGLLTAIGVIIMLKQIPVALGVDASLLVDEKGHPFEPLPLLSRFPSLLPKLNPLVALIGGTGLALMAGMSFLRHPILRRVPPQIVVLLVAVPLALWIGIPAGADAAPHTYAFAGHEYTLTKKLLVDVPNNIVAGLALPNFDAIRQTVAIKWIVLFSLIGSLESLLSAKAVDLLDPQRRRTDLNRDLLAVGVANTLVACVGGLPMISEIVRSRANIDAGAQTKRANLFHGLFLLVFVAAFPSLLRLIPNAALAAMLIYTGFRLAHPREFMHMLHVGKEQLVIYAMTIVAVLATDLLIGIAIGIGVKFAVHLWNGVPVSSLFKPILDVEITGPQACRVSVRQSAIFSNWIAFRGQLQRLGLRDRNNLTIDLSGTKLVDHTVMEKLHEMQHEFDAAGLQLEIVGLENHRPLSSHPRAARKQVAIAGK